MFIGHFALGFAAKRAAPRTSLAVLCGAAQTADLLWPVLVGAGVEQVRIDPGNTAFTPLDFVSYPYSHSLVWLCVWGVVFGLVYGGWVRRTPDATLSRTTSSRTFILLLVLVVSHWMLDFVTHRPDMPILPSGPKVGLGLWNSVPATIAIESAMYVAGLWIYVRSTRARDTRGRWGFRALAVFLVIAYVANVAGPPPPTVGVLWVFAIVGAAILILWIWWVDRHRDAILALD
jgi:hypothetical protein